MSSRWFAFEFVNFLAKSSTILQKLMAKLHHVPDSRHLIRRNVLNTFWNSPDMSVISVGWLRSTWGALVEVIFSTFFRSRQYQLRARVLDYETAVEDSKRP